MVVDRHSTFLIRSLLSLVQRLKLVHGFDQVFGCVTLGYESSVLVNMTLEVEEKKMEAHCISAVICLSSSLVGIAMLTSIVMWAYADML